MKKTLRTAVLIAVTSGFALPSAFAGMGGGIPSPIRGTQNAVISSLTSVVLSLLNL
jgi:hypothetical protein